MSMKRRAPAVQGPPPRRSTANGARIERAVAHVVKVSHTLTLDIAERLREFAFHQRFSESAVIEYALVRLFSSSDDAALGSALRRSGAGRRRKS
jgi:hypothetical protein